MNLTLIYNILLLLISRRTLSLIDVYSQSCDRTNSCANTKRDGNTIYFGLMLSYPDPLGREEAAYYDDGHDIAPAAYLAVEQINNRSDLLSDYQVKLIRLDGGCTVTERTVVGLNELVCSCEPIVGVVGPSCGTSTLRVGQLTGMDRFPMITMHYGERDIFRDRETFPYAFAMIGANFITIQALTDLIVYNGWTKIVILHSEDCTDLNEVSIGVENNIKITPGFDVALTSPIYKNFVPLDEIKQSFARVIIVLTSANSTLRTLCLAYHKGMIFPTYQWIFKERIEYEFHEVKFKYQGVQYHCTDENVNASTHGSINLLWNAVSAENIRNDTDIGLTSTEYEHQYNLQRSKYFDKYGEQSKIIEWARVSYDAVWSLAFALNSSLEEININLSQINPGSNLLASTIAKHMLDVDFQGISGRVSFNNTIGTNVAGQLNIYQFGEEKSINLIGFYASGKLTLLNDSMPQFIKSAFEERRVQVSIAIAVPFLIITVTILFLAVPIHIINIVYRDHKTIKATSPNLNHIIFIGSYLTVFGNVLLIITEAWQHTSTPSKSHVCNVIPWFLGVGTSMIIGTVCTKTWRLYRIYASSKRVLRLSVKHLSDPVLGGIVGVFVAVDTLISLVWVNIDPLVSTRNTTIKEPVGEDLPTIAVTVTCQSTWLIYWSFVIIGYKCVLTACSFVLAMLTRMEMKEFKTINIIILAYLFAIAFGLGVPVYTIVSIIDVGISVRFIILCLLINSIVYICLFALFLPSIIPLIRDKFCHHEVPQLVLRRHGTYIYSNTKDNKVIMLKHRSLSSNQ